jgi:predicted ATPase
MLLLIAGVPGSGKTTIGDYLRDERGYLHVDMEALIQSAAPGTGWTSILASLAERRRSHPDMVLTWGFIPSQDDEVVRALQRAGHRLVWLDGNREAARRVFLQRGTVPEELLDLQMARIAQLDLDSFDPTVINTFDRDGQFRSLNEIADQILSDRSE